jgi:hypothetical protein
LIDLDDTTASRVTLGPRTKLTADSWEGCPMRVFGVLALLLLTITAAPGQSTRSAASGAPLKLTFAYSANPDCSAYGQTTIRLIEAAKHGSVRIARATDFPSYPASNIRNVCNTHRIAGTVAHYVSQHGFRGIDTVAIEIIFPTGRLERYSYTIDVR